MTSLYNDEEAKKFKTDLDLRVYTSRLLGRDSSLVLHGGGNTSVKSTQIDSLGNSENILYVKGSGWDLATIEAEGFAPVKMEALLKLAELKELNDTEMVKSQREAMTKASAPNPSVEAILHAIIPYKFVDHTHADAVITITNTQDSEEKIKELYGDKVLIIPYIMPGFVLAKLVYDMTRDVVWDELEGMVLMNHGLFTFNDDAKKSYEKTIELVDKAEKYLVDNGAELNIIESGTSVPIVSCEAEASLPSDELHSSSTSPEVELLELAKIRQEISKLKGHATISILNDSNLASYFSKQNIEQIATQGPLTPDHVIRTKRIPAILNISSSTSPEVELRAYVKEYTQYFEDNKTNETMLNPAPNFAILKNRGTLSFGKNAKEANIIKDINEHTFEAILKAEKLGAYKALSAENIFEVEYWELEQAKLKKSGNSPEFSGYVALVLGGVNGIYKECAQMLNDKGAAVVVLDENPEVETMFNDIDIKGLRCDLSSDAKIQNALSVVVKKFGGIDLIVSEVGVFTPSDDLQKLNKEMAKFLKLGIDASIIKGSKNMAKQTREMLLKDKILAGKRVSFDEALSLYEMDFFELGELADAKRKALHGKKTYFNINRHINPTNKCADICKFCAYSANRKNPNEYTMTHEEILSIVKDVESRGAKEVHIVSAHNPDTGLEWYLDIFKKIKDAYPQMHVKALTAAEVDFLARQYSKTYDEILDLMVENGVDSMPGGGAEIFDEKVRDYICKGKVTSDQWLEIHRKWHERGKMSNVTMLFGHVEKREHRIDHMMRIRELQDKTGGFNAFIPLVYQTENNYLKVTEFMTANEILKTMAISRIVLDNVPNIKAYWVTSTVSLALLAQEFGANDLDGTIEKESINSAAGAKSANGVNLEEFVALIKNSGFTPVERDSVYNEIKEW